MEQKSIFQTGFFDGALLINKHHGVSSFGIIELLQNQLIQNHGVKKRDLPKMGHGGTLDPFATGTLVVLVGKGVKLARYFLGSTKVYEGRIRFGETTLPGDPTEGISETSEVIPRSLEEVRSTATRLTVEPYLQIPPMHSAKKQNGEPLYKLAREGIEVDRTPKLCRLYQFDILNFVAPCADFRVKCSSGTYIRTLAKDFAKHLGTVGMLDTLHRAASGVFKVENAWTIDQVSDASKDGKAWWELPCWIPFDRLLDGFNQAQATQSEKQALIHGKQSVVPNILRNFKVNEEALAENDDCVAIYCDQALIGIARKVDGTWGIERVFTHSN